MPEYLAPGVYIEETSYRGKPIEGVSTSTAGMVGRTQRGKEGKPTLVTSFAQFTRAFGDPISKPSEPGDYLGHAVRAFFDNGGLRTYIVRVLGEGAMASDSSGAVNAGHGVVARLASGTSVLPLSSAIKLNSLRGIDTSSTLDFYARDGSGDAFLLVHSTTVAGYDAVRGLISLTTPIPGGVSLREAHTYILVRGLAPEGGATASLIPEFQAKDRGIAGDDLSVRITPSDRPPVRLGGNASAARSEPQLNTFAAGGPSAGDLSITLDGEASLRLVRGGDVLTLDNGDLREEITVDSVADQSVDLDAPLAGFTNDTQVFLVQDRYGEPLAREHLIGTLSPAQVGSTLTVPHAIAALLDAGVQLRFDDTAAGGATSQSVSVDGAWTFSAPLVTLSAPGVVENYGLAVEDTVLTLTATQDRLLVDEGAAFLGPNRAVSDEPVAISTSAGTEERRVSLVDTAAGVVWLDTPLAASEAESWTTVQSLMVAEAGLSTLSVATTGSFYEGAMVEVDDGATKTRFEVESVDSDQRTLTLTGSLASAIDVAADSTARAAYVRVLEFKLDVLLGGVVVETYSNLSFNADQNLNSYPRYYVERVNDTDTGSKYISITAPADALILSQDITDQPASTDGQAIVLAGGSDGDPPQDRHLIGEDNGPSDRSGIQALNARDDISMVAVPGVTSEAVQAALITHAELMRYRVAVLDGQQSDADVTEILAHRNNYDSSHAAYYTPWLETIDLASGRTLEVPPSGHVMGIWARSDNTRGVHKAPANEVVRNITGLKYQFTKGEQDVLNPEGVNLIREFEGRGVRVWGARTLSSDGEWKYLNVRRLFAFLEHSIDNGTQWVVFEPNNEALWARVTKTIESFLFGVWTTGAFIGTSPEQAFFVRCDRSTMTQDDLDNGRLICLIGIVPTKPAEFVVFRIGQTTASES